MSFSSDRVRKVSFAAHALPATRAYSISHNVPISSGTVSGRKSSLARRDVLFKLKQRAEQRKSVSTQQESLQTRSPASIQRFIDTYRESRKYSNIPFTALSDFLDKDDVVDWPASDTGTQIRHDPNAESAIKAPLSTAGLPSDHSRVSSVFYPESSLAPAIAADGTNKPSTSSRPSVINLDSERFRNKRVPQETDTLAIELNNAYFTVQAGSTISHAILLYYQGRGAEMLRELTRSTILTEKRGDVETMVRAQLWKAIILNDMGEVENMPQLLGDVVDALLHSGCGDDGDFYQLSKLWLQYSDTIINYLANEYVRQSSHSLTEAEADAQRSEYQRQLAKITVFLDTQFDHNEWPDPSKALNASRLVYDPRTTGLSSDLNAELQRLQSVNRKLERENCDLKMDNVRYKEERKAIPHLSTAFSKDGRFPFLGHRDDSRQYATDIVDGVVTPGPISALMKQLGQEPCHQLPASFGNTSSGPASKWLAQKHAEWRESSSFDQVPKRPRWDSSSTTRREYSRKYSKASFSPTSPIARGRTYQNSRRTPSWGSSRYPRPLRVRNTGPASSPRNSFNRPNVPQRKASSFDNFRGLLPVSSSALGHKAANSWRGDQLGDTFKRATTDILSTLRTVPRSTAQRHHQPSEDPSPYTRRYLPTQPEFVRESSLEGIHSATDHPSGPSKPLAIPLHHSRKQSLTSPTNTLTPGLLPLTDSLSPSQLKAELPQLHENQERRRRSMSLSSSSPTSPSSTSYEHERRLSLFEYQQRHSASGHSVQSTKQHDGSQDKKVDGSSRSSMSQSTKPPDVVRTDTVSASMSMSSAPSSSVRSSSSKPPSLRSNTSAKSKSRGVIVGIGTAPGTPASKSLLSSAICMPSMATSSSGNDDRSSSDIHVWTSFSAHAPDFTPRRPTKPNALHPQCSSDKSTPPSSQASDYSEQDQFPYNDQSPLSYEADVGVKTSIKDIRINFLLSQLETEQAITLDRARRMSKPVISSPLRRSSQVDEDDDDDEGSLMTAPITPDAARDEKHVAVIRKDISDAPATARHDDDKRQGEDDAPVDDANGTDDRKQRRSILEAIDVAIQARSRPSSFEKEPTASESHNYSRGSSWRNASEQAAQLVQKDEQLEQVAKAQSVSEGIEVAPKLAAWQRFVGGEDWRNGRSRFPRQMKQQSTYRNGSVAARGTGNWQRPSNTSMRPRTDSRELPDAYEQRWKRLSGEIHDAVAPRVKNSKKSTLDNPVGNGSGDEKHTTDRTPGLYASSRDGRQDIDALNRDTPGDVENVEKSKEVQEQETPETHADKEQQYDGSVSSMSDSEETELRADPTASERNETQPRGSPQPRTQLESSRPGQETYRVQSTDVSGVPARSKRYNSTFDQVNYEDIDNSYPSPTSPRQQHIQDFGQLRSYMPAKPMAHHSRSAQRDRRSVQQEHTGVARDALAGPTPNVDGSDYSDYSFSGFRGPYPPGTRSVQSRADARLALRPRESITDTEATTHQHEHIRARQASFPHDRLYRSGSGRTAVPDGTSPASTPAAAASRYKICPPVGPSVEPHVDRTSGVPIGYGHQYQYLPSTTYRYQPQAPMRVQPSTRQQEETGQIWHDVSDPYRSHAKVPRESVWEDQRRAFDEEEEAEVLGSVGEQTVEEQDGDGKGNDVRSPKTNISVNC